MAVRVRFIVFVSPLSLSFLLLLLPSVLSYLCFITTHVWFAGTAMIHGSLFAASTRGLTDLQSFLAS